MSNLRTLVIIDMQYDFLDHSKYPRQLKKLKENITSLIDEWIQNEWPIIVVEFEGSGRTIDQIWTAIGFYPKVYSVVKSECDGSKEIIEKIRARKLSKRLNVCGVYSDECVRATIEGIDEHNQSGVDRQKMDIEVFSDCVWPFIKDHNISKGLKATRIEYLGELSCQSQCLSQLT